MSAASWRSWACAAGPRRPSCGGAGSASSTLPAPRAPPPPAARPAARRRPRPPPPRPPAAPRPPRPPLAPPRGPREPPAGPRGDLAVRGGGDPPVALLVRDGWVERGASLGQRPVLGGQQPQHVRGQPGDGRRLWSVAGDVADGEPPALLVHREHVVEVAAGVQPLAGRLVRDSYLPPRHRRQCSRKQALLQCPAGGQ